MQELQCRKQMKSVAIELVQWKIHLKNSYGLLYVPLTEFSQERANARCMSILILVIWNATNCRHSVGKKSQTMNLSKQWTIINVVFGAFFWYIVPPGCRLSKFDTHIFHEYPDVPKPYNVPSLGKIVILRM